MALTFDEQFLRQGLSVVGVDEAGRGALFGPVVVAAVRLLRPLEGLNDSKQLSPVKRQKLLPEIIKNSCWAVISIPAQVIDSLNILEATKLGMRRTAARVLRFSSAETIVLVDGNRPLYSFEREQTVVKGDALSASIAAASIVAKEHRDKIIRRWAAVYPQYSLGEHKGYGTAAHYDALEKYGPTPLHRKSFRLIHRVSPSQMTFFE